MSSLSLIIGTALEYKRRKSNQMKNNFLNSLLFKSCADTGLLLIRIAFGGMLLTHGLAKLASYSTMSAMFPDPIGLGAKLSFTLIMLAETLGSILVIVGLLTRPAALAVAFGMGVAAFVAHAPVSFAGSEMPLLYMAAFTAIMISGAGRYSLDALACGCCGK